MIKKYICLNLVVCLGIKATVLLSCENDFGIWTDLADQFLFPEKQKLCEEIISESRMKPIQHEPDMNY